MEKSGWNKFVIDNRNGKIRSFFLTYSRDAKKRGRSNGSVFSKKMNLTSTKEAEQVMERHIKDSLVMLPPIKTCYNDLLFDHINLVDVRSGAGLPGLVLAIACPDWRVTLMESIKKCCVFLEHVINVTGLTNVKIVRGRLEVKF